MGKHGPNRLGNYLEVHDKAIRDLKNRGFLVDESLEWTAQGDDFLTLSGKMFCVGGIRIEILKQVLILEGVGATALVQTEAYTYNAVLDGVGNIVRYDSPHLDHNQFHHVHRYDVLAGDKEGAVTELREDERPTLAQVVTELEDWYYSNFERITDSSS